MNNILMNKDMTKAVLDGRKVQTRRVSYDDKHSDIKNAKYQIGETIWVREPAKVYYSTIDYSVDFAKYTYEYIADNKRVTSDIPIRLMKNKEFPNWIVKNQGIPNGCIKEMARIFLKITDVRVERLQDMSDEDCYKEGVIRPTFPNLLHEWKGSKYKNPQTIFRFIYDEVAPKGYMWEDNPYVFVYEFERVKK